MAGFSVKEFSDRFDILYNNITSNQAPGLNEHEKSIFLTKAQDEIIKNYFLPQSNTKQAGFDGNQKRQIDFSALMKVQEAGSYTSNYTYTMSGSQDYLGREIYTRTESSPNQSTSVWEPAYDNTGNPVVNGFVRVGSFFSLTDAHFDKRPNSKSVSLPGDVMMIVNESVTVTRGSSTVDLVCMPISFDEYARLMSKPFKRPVKYQAWRLISSGSYGKSDCDLIAGTNDEIMRYTLRYVRRPRPIILTNLEDDLTINGESTVSECELDPILHEEILQRAVELAKVAWTSNGQDNVQLVMEAGKRSE